jgi:hypothetical protein
LKTFSFSFKCPVFDRIAPLFGGAQVTVYKFMFCLLLARSACTSGRMFVPDGNDEND